LEGLPGLWKRVWWYPYFECRGTRFKVRRGKTFVKAQVDLRNQSAGIPGTAANCEGNIEGIDTVVGRVLL
jgi:hypothetical protein